MTYVALVPLDNEPLLCWCINRIYQRTLCDKDESIEQIFYTFESEHPYGNGVKFVSKIHIPEAGKLRLLFDKRCNIEGDSLIFFRDEDLTVPIAKKLQ